MPRHETAAGDFDAGEFSPHCGKIAGADELFIFPCAGGAAAAPTAGGAAGHGRPAGVSGVPGDQRDAASGAAGGAAGGEKSAQGQRVPPQL